MGRLRWGAVGGALLALGCTAPDDGTIVAAPTSASSSATSTTEASVDTEVAVATSTSTVPPPTTTTLPPRGRLVIHGTGDVNLDPDYIPAFRSRGYGWAWSGLD